MCMPAPRYRVRSGHTSCLCVCVCVYTYICRERERLCVCLRLVIGYTILIRLVCMYEYMYVCMYVCMHVCTYTYTQRERERVCVCLRLIIRNTHTYLTYMYTQTQARRMSTGTRCSYVLPVPRLVLPRLAYHVEHQDKRIRRGVGVRAGGSQGRRGLRAAADNELVTVKHAHAVYSSVLIWLDSFPPSASAFISGL